MEPKIKVNCIICDEPFSLQSSHICSKQKVANRKRRKTRDCAETSIPHESPEYLFNALRVFEAVMNDDGEYCFMDNF